MSSLVREQTAARIERLAGAFQELAKFPGDADAIHHVRVSIRRLTQCLRIFADCFDPGVTEKLERRARRLLKRCGKVRNFDIALKLVDTAKVRDARLTRALTEQRESASRKLAKFVGKLEAKEDWLKPPRIKRDCDIPQPVERLLKQWTRAGDVAIAGNSPEALHRFRLLGKRLRYTAELFVPENDPLLKRLKSVQDHLGEINDCAATLPLVQGHPRAEAALTKLLRSRETKFRASWKSTSSATAKPSPAPPRNPTKRANSRPKASATSEP